MSAAKLASVASALLSMGFLWTTRGYAAEAPSTAATDSAPQIQSAEQIAAQFQRPTGLVPLLENLKRTLERDLLLQPAFYEDSVLLKVFPAQSVTRTFPPGIHSEVSLVIVDPHFPHLSVSIREGEAPWDSSAPQAPRFATLKMSVAELPHFTVCTVTDVFGQHAVFSLDSGVTSHGVGYTAEGKGFVRYPYYSDESATPGPPYSKRYLNKQIIFGIKFEPDTIRTEPLLPTQLERIRYRDEVRDITINIENRGGK